MTTARPTIAARTWLGRGLAWAMLAGNLVSGAAARLLPQVFPQKQLIFKADSMVTTDYSRPGDGTRHRIRERWIALSQTRKTKVEDRNATVRRYRGLTYVEWAAKNGRVMRFNNRDEFCAWAKDFWIGAVEFQDLGVVAGRDECGESLDHYLLRQHPENDEWLIEAGLVNGEPIYNPFAGRPKDADYGDYFKLELDVEQQVGHDDGHVSWETLPAGGPNVGGGRTRYRVRVISDDILPLRLKSMEFIARHHDRTGRQDEQPIGAIVRDELDDFPIQVAPGETYEESFGDMPLMRDLADRVVRVHFLVRYEDPWGNDKRKRISRWWWRGVDY